MHNVTRWKKNRTFFLPKILGKTVTRHSATVWTIRDTAKKIDDQIVSMASNYVAFDCVHRSKWAHTCLYVRVCDMMQSEFALMQNEFRFCRFHTKNAKVNSSACVRCEILGASIVIRTILFVEWDGNEPFQIWSIDIGSVHRHQPGYKIQDTFWLIRNSGPTIVSVRTNCDKIVATTWYAETIAAICSPNVKKSKISEPKRNKELCEQFKLYDDWKWIKRHTIVPM